jgi:hypothetical protein
MLMISPKTFFNEAFMPIALVSGNRAVYISDGATVQALQRAGIPLTSMPTQDWARIMLCMPGDDGPTLNTAQLQQLAGPIP